MPILVQCPYCGQGKVNAPESAIGLTVVCRLCSSCFTIAPDTLMPKAATPAAARLVESRKTTTRTDAAARAETALAVLTGAPTEPSTAVASVAPVAPVEVVPVPQRSDSSFVPALIALCCGGIGLAVSQLPYGRFGTVGLGVIGLAFAGVAVAMAQGKRWLPTAALSLNGLALLLAVLLPEWLGVSSWRPVRTADDSNVVRAVGLQDGLASPAEWVDVSKAAWQRDDVRVGVSGFTIAPVELVGAKDKRVWTKEPVLQIRVKVENVGVARPFEVHPWPTASGPESPRLTDASGKVITFKKFADGWTPSARPPQPKVLFPGRSTEQLLIFDAPGKTSGDLRLELPASVFGGTESVKLLLPRN
jgi:hypothetical protein